MIKGQGGEVTNLPLDFSSNEFQPLAAKMRPINLEQYIGQLHLLAKDKPLARAIWCRPTAFHDFVGPARYRKQYPS